MHQNSFSAGAPCSGPRWGAWELTTLPRIPGTPSRLGRGTPLPDTIKVFVMLIGFPLIFMLFFCIITSVIPQNKWKYSYAQFHRRRRGDETVLSRRRRRCKLGISNLSKFDYSDNVLVTWCESFLLPLAHATCVFIFVVSNIRNAWQCLSVAQLESTTRKTTTTERTTTTALPKRDPPITAVQSTASSSNHTFVLSGTSRSGTDPTSGCSWLCSSACFGGRPLHKKPNARSVVSNRIRMKFVLRDFEYKRIG